MPNNFRFELDREGVKEILRSQEVINRIKAEFGVALLRKAEQAYPDGNWELDTRISSDRQSLIVKSDNDTIPFREATTGRLRRALRRPL